MARRARVAAVTLEPPTGRMPAHLRARVERLRALVAQPGTPGEGRAALHALRALLVKYGACSESSAIVLDAGYVSSGRALWVGTKPFSEERWIGRLDADAAGGCLRGGFCLHAVEARAADGSVRAVLCDRRGPGLFALGHDRIGVGETLEVRAHGELAGRFRVVVSESMAAAAILERATWLLGA